MEVAIARDEEVGIARPVGCAVPLEHVSRDLLQVEHGREEAVAILLAEHPRRITGEAGRNRRPKLRHHGHQVARPLVAIDDAVLLAVHAAVDGVHERIAAPELRMLEKRGCEDPFALRREGDLHRVVHAAGHHHFNARVPGPPPQDVCGTRDEGSLAGAIVGLLRERPFGPVDPAVRSEVRPVQIVGARGQRFSFEPLLAPIGDAVAVRIRQLPDARRSRHVERAVEPHRPFREHHAIREDDAGIEPAVAVRIFEADDAMGPLLQLLLDLVVRSGRVRHIQATFLVEISHDRPVDERGSRDGLDDEARGDGQVEGGAPRLCGRVREEGGGREQGRGAERELKCDRRHGPSRSDG